MYEYFYAFVEFKGGQYQDGLMATCPVEETNEMLSVQIRVDDNFQISICFIRLQDDSQTFLFFTLVNTPEITIRTGLPL